MCTVTFLPFSKDGFILTSSRDVSYNRAPALEPKAYTEGGVSLFYPKDGEAGGTWIGSSDQQRLICLLNGGFKNHQSNKFYARSRGLVVKDLLKANNFTTACLEITLEAIEPFTLVVIDWKTNLFLHEFVWDGDQRHLNRLEWQPRIWSSATLYSSQMKAEREKWFSSWLEADTLSPNGILDFHQNAGSGDPYQDVFMRREKVGTVSITQFVKDRDQQTMDYFGYGSK